jgi:hypothetical protein
MKITVDIVDQVKKLLLQTKETLLIMLWTCWEYMLVSLEHFERQSEHALYCCQIYTLSTVRISRSIVLAHTRTFCNSFLSGLAPCDRFLVWKLNMMLEGKIFNDISVIQAKSWEALVNI